MAFVVCLVLGSLPRRHVGLRLTPNLWTLAHGAPGVGRAVLPSLSTPNLATFMTGVPPEQHGLWGRRVMVDGAVRRAADVGPAVPTMFDLCRASGVGSVGLAVDEATFGAGGFHRADLHWPTDSVPHSGGASTAEDTVARVLDGLEHLHDGQSGLLVATMNGASGTVNGHGPDSPEGAAALAELDSDVAMIVRTVRRRWSDTVLVLVSDHDQLTVTERVPLDVCALETELMERTGAPVTVLVDGDAAIVQWASAPAIAGPTLRSIYRRHASIDGSTRLSSTVHLLWAAPGALFDSNERKGRLAAWGGPHTRGQLAIVSGGHESVEAIRENARRGPVPATRWAPTIAAVLGLSQHRPAASLAR